MDLQTLKAANIYDFKYWGERFRGGKTFVKNYTEN